MDNENIVLTDHMKEIGTRHNTPINIKKNIEYPKNFI